MKKNVWIPTLVSIVLAVGLGLAQEQQTNPTAAEPAPSLTVAEAVICTGISDRVPQGVLQAGQLTPPPLSNGGGGGDPFPFKLTCFTKTSGTPAATIKHVWYCGEKQVFTQELAIGGSPWRTWSSKEIRRNMVGPWKLEIQDAGGAVLKTINFAVNDKGESELK